MLQTRIICDWCGYDEVYEPEYREWHKRDDKDMCWECKQETTCTKCHEWFDYYMFEGECRECVVKRTFITAMAAHIMKRE